MGLLAIISVLFVESSLVFFIQFCCFGGYSPCFTLVHNVEEESADITQILSGENGHSLVMRNGGLGDTCVLVATNIFLMATGSWKFFQTAQSGHTRSWLAFVSGRTIWIHKITPK